MKAQRGWLDIEIVQHYDCTYHLRGADRPLYWRTWEKQESNQEVMLSELRVLPRYANRIGLREVTPALTLLLPRPMEVRLEIEYWPNRQVVDEWMQQYVAAPFSFRCRAPLLDVLYVECEPCTLTREWNREMGIRGAFENLGYAVVNLYENFIGWTSSEWRRQMGRVDHERLKAYEFFRAIREIPDR